MVSFIITSWVYIGCALLSVVTCMFLLSKLGILSADAGVFYIVVTDGA
jgi:hypothetical protein